jgi:hypothetical protein
MAEPNIPESVLNELLGRTNEYDPAASVPDKLSRRMVTRTPFIFSSRYYLASKLPEIAWFSNPSEVSWRIPVRGGEQVTKTGRVTHNWWDERRGTFYDEPELTFQLQVGNILPIFANDSGKFEIAEGLDNFYALLQFLNQPRFLKDGQTNTVFITYHSMIFPSLVLEGQFKQEGIAFSDSAESANTVNGLTVSFIVYKTVPELFTADALVSEFKKFGFNGGVPMAATSANAGGASTGAVTAGGLETRTADANRLEA